MCSVPSWRLSATDVRVRLLGFLAEPCGTIGVLLANGLPVGQVLGPVDDKYQGSDERAVNRHVGEDASGMLPRQGTLQLGGHDCCLCRGCSVVLIGVDCPIRRLRSFVYFGRTEQLYKPRPQLELECHSEEC